MWTHNKYIETDQEERGRGREGGRVMDSTEREREGDGLYRERG